jgi:glycosyltransferase involved in cell wall biosynthesis
MADCLARAGHGAKAVAVLEDHQMITRSDPGSLYAAARLGVRAGDPVVALPLLEDVLRLDPDHEKALDGKLSTLRHAGRFDEAAVVAAELEARGGAAALRAASRHRLAAGDPVGALGLLERAGDNAETSALAARALLTLGRYHEAEQRAEAALRVEPGHATARRWLEEAVGERSSTHDLRVMLPPRTRPLEPIPGRVLHLVTSSLPHVLAGYTVRSQAIGRAQIDAGLDPHFVTAPGFPKTGESVLDHVEDVPYHRLSPGVEVRPADVLIESYARSAADLVETLRPSVLHAATGFPNAVAALSLREVYDIPVVYEVRGFLEDSWVAANSWADPESDRYRWRRQAEVECMQAADSVVTLAETMKAEIERWGVPGEKIWVVPNAVDVDRFRPGPRTQTLANSLGIGADEVTVGYISSLSAYEGLEYLIEAIALLLERGHQVRGVLVGDGPERASLEKRAMELGVVGRIVFTGSVPQSDVIDYYRLLDVFVSPRTATRVAQLVTPLKLYEAMAMEIAVIASATPALKEMVVDDETGLCALPEDTRDLADKIEILMTDPKLRVRLGRAARRWVMENRTWERNGLTYIEIYRDIS